MISCSSSRTTSSPADPRRARIRGCRPLLLILLLACLPPGATAAPVDEVRALLTRGDAAGAYERGRRYPDQLGEPAFDYWYGMAAIDAGHAAEGTLALERYVITYPADRNARLELARGYFVLGDDVRAREEFAAVLAADPPAAVRANVQRYLDAIQARESRSRTTVSFYAEAGAGYDSNVNGGVSSPTLNLPIGTVSVQAASVKSDNGFLSAAAGMQVQMPLTPAWSLFAAASADTKNHFQQDAFDLRGLSLSAGAAWLGKRDLLRITGTAGTLLLDNNRFRDVHALTGEWFRSLDPATTLSVSAQYAQLGYTGDNAPRDADLYTLGAGARRTYEARWSPVLSASASVGRERNRRSRDDLGRDFYGLRGGVGVTPRERWTASLGATIQRSEYLEADSLLGATRRDWYAALEGAAAYALTREWSLRAEWLASVNRSSIELYEYRRNVMLFKLRYETR